MRMMSTLNSRTEARGDSPSPPPGDHMTTKSLPAGPRQVAPPHPGSVIADALAGAGISMRQAAKAIGMSPTGLNKVLLGESPVTPATALKISAFIGSEAEMWMGLQVDYDLWHERRRLATELAAIVPAEDRQAA